jgi:hypothetical protein
MPGRVVILAVAFVTLVTLVLPLASRPWLGPETR